MVRRKVKVCCIILVESSFKGILKMTKSLKAYKLMIKSFTLANSKKDCAMEKVSSKQCKLCMLEHSIPDNFQQYIKNNKQGLAV